MEEIERGTLPDQTPPYLRKFPASFFLNQWQEERAMHVNEERSFAISVSIKFALSNIHNQQSIVTFIQMV